MQTPDAVNDVVNELTAAGFRLLVGRGWHKGPDRTHMDLVQDAAVFAFQRRGVPPTARAVANTMAALPRVRPEPAVAADDDGIPTPTSDELAVEAAWVVDTFYMYGWTRQNSAWAYDDDRVSVDAAPENLRRLAFRAALFVASAHGLPQSKAPNMRQVIRALMQRMAKEKRLSR